MFSEPKNPHYEGFEGRINFIGLVIVLACGVLAARLWELQVVRWDEFETKSRENRLRPQRLEAPRGMIIGRNGADENVVLADNRASRDLLFVPANCDRDPAEVCRRLESLLGIDGDALLREVEKAIKARQPHRQILIKRDVARSVLGRIEEYSFALPGVFTVVRPQRRYLYGATGGQVLGYLGEISLRQLEAMADRYTMGDWIGQAGLERVYEDLLHGRDGHMLVTQFARGAPQLRTDAYGRPYVEVDDFGHTLAEEYVQYPESGRSLYVTLDIGLQAKAEALLEGEHGAIVVLNAATGEVLALASTPGYDPSVFVNRTQSHLRGEILGGTPNRMKHRAFQENYPPGSVFKVLMAAAALETGVITERTTYYCPGQFRLTPGGRAWRCWRRGGHGRVDVIDALAFSCDVFFYNVGLELGVDRIKEWCARVGLGEKTGIDLPGEVAGLIPSKEWKEALLGPKHPNEPWEYRWYPGDTVNLSIGQGSAAVTPLQNAVLMAAVINGGYRVRPYLNRELGPARSERLWGDETADIVRRGMLKCVEKGPPAPTGTGRQAAVPGFAVLGKTGSAQIVGLHHQDYANEEDIPKHLRDHAWFVSGVLDRDPPIAMCILVEHGHHGSSEAAPLAAEIIRYFYSERGGPSLTVARQ